MANVPQDLKYTEQHEYLKPAGEDGVFFVGITDYAQGELGDIVFVELPKPGSRYDAGAVFGTIEAVKAVSDLYMPVSGEVVEANGALDANPAAIIKSGDVGKIDYILVSHGHSDHFAD
jgi:glycine cleavage system H protein